MLQKTWEKNLLIQKYEAENFVIFRLEIIREDIDETIKIFKRDNKLDYEEKFFIEFIRKSTVMIIFKLKMNSLLHQAIMRLSFSLQVQESISHQSVQSSENMSSSSAKIKQSVKYQKITHS